MMLGYRAGANRLHRADLVVQRLEELAWIDMQAPGAAEEQAIERALGIEMPTREDMQEIEPSSRIYHENGTLFLTAQIIATPAEGEGSLLDIGPVTFMLQAGRLVTLHYHPIGSFTFFADWAERYDTPSDSGSAVFLGLMEAVVDRLADTLEAEARRHDQLSKAIFSGGAKKTAPPDLTHVLQAIGQAEDRNAKITESLTTIQRLLGFLSVPAVPGARDVLRGLDHEQLKSLAHDVRSLREVARTQAEKIRFQLDATLGVINIHQSDVIKIFSVVAFVFLPPTLIASIYGMNFEVMPELSWRWGYPAALLLMLASAIVPWRLFRWKKWL